MKRKVIDGWCRVLFRRLLPSERIATRFLSRRKKKLTQDRIGGGELNWPVLPASRRLIFDAERRGCSKLCRCCRGMQSRGIAGLRNKRGRIGRIDVFNRIALLDRMLLNKAQYLESSHGRLGCLVGGLVRRKAQAKFVTGRSRTQLVTCSADGSMPPSEVRSAASSVCLLLSVMASSSLDQKRLDGEGGTRYVDRPRAGAWFDGAQQRVGSQHHRRRVRLGFTSPPYKAPRSSERRRSARSNILLPFAKRISSREENTYGQDPAHVPRRRGA
jgi:hypothetical protein